MQRYSLVYFHLPVGETEFLTMENIRKNYTPVYVIRGVFWWGSGRKDILDLIATSVT
jgi:hypothetical protein